MSSGHVISRFGDVPWRPCSTHLSTCDLIFWGYLKTKVYNSKLRTIQELKWSISQELEAVPIEMLKKTMKRFEERLRIYDREKERYLTYII